MLKKLLVMPLLYTLLTGICQGHSWYPVECCSGSDCRPVQCDTLTEDNDGGFTYHGDGFTVKYTKDQVKPSKDGMCHVCHSNYAKDPYCVFILPSS